MHVIRIHTSCPGSKALGAQASAVGLYSANFPYDFRTFWLLDQGFGSAGQPLGATLRHLETGLWLKAQPNGTLSLGPVQQFDGWSTWSFGRLPNRSVAIRPWANPDLNLNLLGGCGGSNVGLWGGWGGGQANETWWFARPATSPAPPPPVRYRIRTGCADVKGNHLDLALGQSDPVVLGSPDVEKCIWNVELVFGAQDEIQDGVAIVNAQNGQALRCMGSNTKVGFTGAGSTDPWSRWTFGGGGTWLAVRPLADDYQNLNVMGGCYGGNTPIATWRWSGGAPNEIWSIVRLT